MNCCRDIHWTRGLAGLAFLMAFWPTADAVAIPRSWIGGTGAWSTPGLWSPAGVPGAGDEVFIWPNDGVARTVTYDYAGPAVTLTAVLLDLNVGAAGTTTLAMPGNSLSATNMYVGYNGSGTLTQTGGTTDVGTTLYVATNFGSSGAVSVSGATTSLEADWINMGNQGDGTLTVENGGLVSVLNRIGIGDALNGVGTTVVRGASSTINAIGWMDVGSSGHGTLTITEQGRVTSGGVYVGAGPSGFGQVYVDGAGSILDPNFISVGAQGQGELFVSNSGIAMSHHGIVVGGNVGGVGNATVSGAGSEFYATWYLSVGAEGYGSLLVEDGGVAEADNGFSIGAQATGVGDAHVTGTGSRLEGAWNVLVGEHGEGELTVDNGGLVTSPGWLIVGNQNGSYGTLNVGAGGIARSDQQVQFGDLAGSAGDALVSGAGAKLISTWWTSVGNAGQATLTIENGATAEAHNGIVIGDLASGRGNVTVRGAGSNLTADWGIEVGDDGQGALAVSDGATVAAQNGFDIGRGASGVGEVTVTGNGSSASGVWYIRVAEHGEGVMSVASGGSVSTPSDFDVATQLDSKGVVNINSGGTVSSFNTAIGGTAAGAGGRGVVNINGGTFNVSNLLRIWNGPGNVLNLRGGTLAANGLSLQGNPSLLNWTGGTLHITAGVTFDPLSVPPTGGIFGAARTISGTRKLKITGIEGLGGTGGFGLTVTNGGVHEVSDTIVINPNGALHLHNGGTVIANRIDHTSGGTFDFTGGTLHVNNFFGDLTNAGGTLAPGNSIGTTAVSGDYTQNAGTLQIEIASATSYDFLDLNGANQEFGGTLQVLLINGYSPAEGASFNILDWDFTSSGTFALSLPTLAESLAWNTSQLHSAGILSVVAAAGLLGDSNQDGAVNAADYVSWRKLDGANENGYTTWRQHFGEPAGGGAAEEQSPVPEPISASPLVTGLLLTVLGRRFFRR